jgi:2,4-dichlorophenol 6-monooxygenase
MAYETDVLIIGAGPTGSTTALALANCGVRSHIVSRGNWMADSPRAHITNQRANEVFRDLGISDDVARYASPWEQMGDTTFSTSLAGQELIRMRTWGTGDDRRGDYLRARSSNRSWSQSYSRRRPIKALRSPSTPNMLATSRMTTA